MVLSASIGALGALGSAGIGAISAGHSAYQQYQYQRSLQEQAAQLNYDYNKKYTKWSSKNAPSYNRQGLEKAGYNPLLALGNIGGSSSLGSVTSAGSAGMPDYGEAVNNAFQALNYKKEREETNSRIDLNASNIRLNDITSRKVGAEQYRQSIENYYLPSVLESNIANIKSNTALQEMQTTAQMLTNQYLPDKMKAEIYTMYKNAESNAIGAQASMVTAGANVTSAKANLINAKENKRFNDYRVEGMEFDNIYKGRWLNGFDPNFYNYGLNGMQKHQYK